MFGISGARNFAKVSPQKKNTVYSSSGTEQHSVQHHSDSENKYVLFVLFTILNPSNPELCFSCPSILFVITWDSLFVEGGLNLHLFGGLCRLTYRFAYDCFTLTSRFLCYDLFRCFGLRFVRPNFLIVFTLRSSYMWCPITPKNDSR